MDVSRSDTDGVVVSLAMKTQFRWQSIEAGSDTDGVVADLLIPAREPESLASGD